MVTLYRVTIMLVLSIGFCSHINTFPQKGDLFNRKTNPNLRQKYTSRRRARVRGVTRLRSDWFSFGSSSVGVDVSA